MGAGIIILLACLEPLLVANVYWEYNRLLADIIILLAVVVVNVRYRAAADTLRKQDDSRFLDTAE
jgi:hypothetical protein